MEEYLKKQAAKKQGQAAPPSQSPPKAEKKAKDFTESSDKYTDEEFESISKSQSLGIAKSAPKSTFAAQQRAVPQETNFVQTEISKYSTTNQDTGTAKTWTLQRNLEDAEIAIQEHKNKHAEYRDDIFKIEQKMKKIEMEAQAAKREALNASETNTRLKE